MMPSLFALSAQHPSHTLTDRQMFSAFLFFIFVLSVCSLWGSSCTSFASSPTVFSCSLSGNSLFGTQYVFLTPAPAAAAAAAAAAFLNSFWRPLSTSCAFCCLLKQCPKVGLFPECAVSSWGVQTLNSCAVRASVFVAAASVCLRNRTPIQTKADSLLSTHVQ